jgi:hypothetical protein
MLHACKCCPRINAEFKDAAWHGSKLRYIRSHSCPDDAALAAITTNQIAVAQRVLLRMCSTPTCSSEVLLTAGRALLPCLLARQRDGGVLERDSMVPRCPAVAVLLDDLASQNALLAAASVLLIWMPSMR